MNKNTNCLKGRKCPNCAQSDQFKVAATSVFDLLDSGTDGHGHVECDENSAAECPKCGWTGKWGETYERLCRHCRAPILLREADGRWVHKDVDDNPAGEFYGWISCGGGVDDAVAEPEQEAPKHR